MEQPIVEDHGGYVMKIMVACDHAGLSLKQRIIPYLEAFHCHVEDAGTYSHDSVDYPRFAVKVARAVANGEADRGILICGSGIGMCMAANRIHGIRAVHACGPYEAKMSRRHNDSNVLCLGGRFIGQDMAVEIIDTWLKESFEGGRHQRRVDLIDELTQ